MARQGLDPNGGPSRSPLPLLILGVLILFSTGSAANAADLASRDHSIAEAKELMKKGRHRAAEEAFRKASRLGEGPCFDCLVGLAGALSELGRHGEAVKAAREAIQIENIPPTRLALAYNELGAAQANESERNFDEAEANLRKSIELGQDAVPLARYNLAELLRRRGRAAESAAMARSYLAVDLAGQKARDARVVLCRVAEQSGVTRPDTGKAVLLSDVPAAGPLQRIYAPSVSLMPQSSLAGSKLKANMAFELLIDQEGCVRQVQVLQEANKNLAKSFADSMRQSVYQPVVVDGQPVAVRYELKVKIGG